MFAERFLSLEGAFNVRDLGGLPTAEGRLVRTGRVFRADSPALLTDADKSAVRSLQVAQVLDLRSGPEAEEGSWAVHPDMRRTVFEIIDPAKHPHPASGVALPAMPDHEAFAQRYVKRLTEGGPKLVAAAQALTRSVDEGVIFHCSAGKDRTGLLAAFVLTALGVDREHVIMDYGASDEPMQRKFAFHLANPETMSFDPAQVPPLMLRAPAPVMRRLLDLADEQWGGIVARFQECGFSDDDLAELRGKLLV